MITEAAFFGGSITLGAATSPQINPLRAFAIRNDDTSSFGTPGYRMPDVKSNPRYWAMYEGRAMFMIIADNSVSPRVKNHAGLVIATITSGNVGFVYLISAENDTWHVTQRAKNTARTAAAVGALTPTVATTTATYDPFCFNGDDCEFLEQEGLLELDVLLPLYQDPSVMTNATREAIRAADVTMPNKILVRIEKDSFEVDANHPWNGVYSLSDAFFEALYGTKDAVNSQLGSAPRPFVLEYDAALSASGTSEHPYHTHRAGGAWAHGPGTEDMPVFRHVWKAERTYGPDDEHTLQLRFVMEHTLDNDPVLDTGEIGSGTVNAYGAWGGVCSLYIFTDELNPTWVDDSTGFSPVGFDGTYTWNRSDPFATGLAFAKAGTETGTKEAKKGLHPQCVAAATLAMSWHAPTGRNHVPLDEYEIVPGTTTLAGKNLEASYEVPNGSPWTDLGSCTEEAPIRYTVAGETTGIIGNVVFGDTTIARAMTLGGDLPTSRVNEWLCWENGNGDGDTFLKPLKPGWNVDCGNLDVAGGNSATIAICTEGAGWEQNEISPCDGHPLEPFGVGGSHRCFKNRAGDTTAGVIEDHCCIETTSTEAVFYELCTRQISEFGDPTFSGCSPTEATKCETVGTFVTRFAMPVEDYDITNRILTYAAYRGVPTSLDRSYTYDSESVSTLTQAIGSWSLGQSFITATAAAGSNRVRAMLSHNDTSSGLWSWFGVQITGRFENTLTAGCGAGWMYEAGFNSAKGLGLHVSPVNNDKVLVEVSWYDGATKTVLASQQLDGVSTSGEFSAKFHGTEYTVTYTPDVGPSASMTGHFWDPEMNPISTLMVGVLFTEDASPASQFSDVVWTDIVKDLNEAVQATVVSDQISIFCDGEEYLNGYGKCEGSLNPDCGADSENCNCQRIDYTKYEGLAAVYSPNPWRDVDDGRVAAGACSRVDRDCEGDTVYDNPTSHGGANPYRCFTDPGVCPPDTNPIADCPANRKLIAFALPTSQECYRSNTGDDPDVECVNGIPRICRGIDLWTVSFTTCD